MIHAASVDLGGTRVVDNVSFSLQTGETGGLLGPSGCGKTTLLRAIAGFEQPTEGQIRIRDRVVSGTGRHLAPERRGIGMVFQDLALFPHLTVVGNVGFGIRQMGTDLIRRRVFELLEMVGLEKYADMYPHELSGGQQQRVALIRAIAPAPDLLLLDEPFSGQDPELRQQLAHELREVLRQQGVTALLVTHDQLEAFAFSDRVGVLHGGRLCQWDLGYNLYHWPADRFVAEFVGRGVFIPATVLDEHRLRTSFGVITGNLSTVWPSVTEVDLLLRPDDIHYDPEGSICARVESSTFRGADYLYTLVLQDGTRIMCLAPSHFVHRPGDRIGVCLDLQHLVVFPRAHPA